LSELGLTDVKCAPADDLLGAQATAGRGLLAKLLRCSWNDVAEEWRLLLATEGLPYQRRRANSERQRVRLSFDHIATLLLQSLDVDSDRSRCAGEALLALYRQFGRDWAGREEAEPALVVSSPLVTRALARVIVHTHSVSLPQAELFAVISAVNSVALDLALARLAGYVAYKESLLTELRGMHDESDPAPAARPDSLTHREVDVLALIATGATTKEIAANLFLSEHTVKRHTSNIYQKLGVNHRSEAAVEAVRLGLVRPLQRHELVNALA
jgi:DNA-binding CsgD family transcriptional regulator